MSEYEHGNFDLLDGVVLQEFLCDQLDGQLGRSEVHFRQHISAGMLTLNGVAGTGIVHTEPTDNRVLQNVEVSPKNSWLSGVRFPKRLGPWSSGLVGAALAASVTIFLARPSMRPTSPADSGTPTSAIPGTEGAPQMFLAQDVESQTFDNGISMLNGGTPVRVLHQHDLERTRWFDQKKNFKGEQVVPRDHMIYVQLKTY